MRKLPKALTDLSDLPQWVAWNDTNGRKIPKAVGGGNAKSNDPSTWGTLGEAIAEAERNGYTGVGIELDNGLVGIDLDGCVHDGQIDPWAQEIIDEVGSYAETSPSGTGVHILATGDPGTLGALGRANHSKGIEVYNHGRYFTVTGSAINDAGIVDATDAISSVMGREFPEPSPEDALKEELARLAKSQVSRRANETVSHNVRRDSKSGVRFARVPMGLHTCDFCNMLASRGFVYWSKESAGEFSHWHADCRCKVVPGVPEIKSYWKNGVHVTRGIDPSVEGYDPDSFLAVHGNSAGTRDENGKSQAVPATMPRNQQSGASGLPIGVHAKTGNMDQSEYAEYRRELNQARGLKQIKLPRNEYAHVMSELNTHMSAEDRKHAIVTKSIGDYRYTIVNMGFDDYRIVGKEPIQ